jgi:hypothetical protein
MTCDDLICGEIHVIGIRYHNGDLLVTELIDGENVVFLAPVLSLAGRGQGKRKAGNEDEDSLRVEDHLSLSATVPPLEVLHSEKEEI